MAAASSLFPAFLQISTKAVYLDVAGAVLAQAVAVDGAEDVAEDGLLPLLQLKGCTGPLAFGVFEGAHEHDGALGKVSVDHWMRFSSGSSAVFSLGSMRRARELGVMPNSVQNALICFTQAWTT